MTTFRRMVDGEVLGTTARAGYTVASGLKAVIHKLSFTNTSSGEVTVTAYLVPKTKTASDTYIIADAKVLQVRQTWSCPDAEGQVLNQGGSIHYFSNAPNSVTVIASGVEISS